MKVKIADLYDLSNTIAAPLLERFEYPWEALAHIKEFILELGPTLPADEFDNPAEGVWIAKDAKIYDSAYIGSPLIMSHMRFSIPRMYHDVSQMVTSMCPIAARSEAWISSTCFLCSSSASRKTGKG